MANSALIMARREFPKRRTWRRTRIHNRNKKAGIWPKPKVFSDKAWWLSCGKRIAGENLHDKLDTGAESKGLESLFNLTRYLVHNVRAMLGLAHSGEIIIFNTEYDSNLVSIRSNYNTISWSGLIELQLNLEESIYAGQLGQYLEAMNKS